MSFPPDATSKMDWPKLAFKVIDVNGHVECIYNAEDGWSEPKFVEDPYLRIHGMAPGLNYGQQCYEGLKAFRQKDGQIRIFRPDKNAKRMQHSASYVSIPEPPEAMFLKAVHMCVARNAEWVPPYETGAALYIRPLLFAPAPQLPLNPPSQDTSFLVYVTPVGVYHGVKPVDALILEDFDRAAPHGTGSAKIGGNYAPVLRHSQKALETGYGITLHLDSQTRSYIEEFSTSGFIGMKKGGEGVQPTFVIPLSNTNSVIDSVMADSSAIIAKDLGWKVEKRLVHFEELIEFDEVAAAGTAASLVPIRSITMLGKNKKFEYVQGDTPGDMFNKLFDSLKGIQRGIYDDKFGWCQLVRDPHEEGKGEKAQNGNAS